jgi:DNA-binding transcriptional MocR family regulator
MAGVTASDLTAALADWAHGAGPLYQRLATAIAALVDAGRLPARAVLPPERLLADALGVSRSTVVAAFEELKRTGQLEARQGSGTWVRARPRPRDEGNRELVQALEDHAILRDLAGGPVQPIEFLAAAVDCSPETIAASTTLDPAEVARWSTGHGYVPQGIEPLRVAVADHLSEIGLATTPQQVLVTTGATQGVLLAARLFLEPGAPAVVESPTYPGAIDVLHAAGARLLSVGVDASGARTDQLADVLARSLPHLVYLVPDFHNPTGAVLSDRRRAEVARLAAEFHVPVVEDLVQRDLWTDTPPPPPIASYDAEAPVLTLGSLSKVHWGGLRIGWVRANEATITRLARMKAVTDFGTPVVAQLVAARLLPDLGQAAACRRLELADRLAVLEAAAASHLPGWSCPRPAGGLCVWAQLPEPRADELVHRAAQHGVAVVPGTTFAVGDQRHADRVRLPFVAEPAVIIEGVRRLGRAWADMAESTARPAAQALVV